MGPLSSPTISSCSPTARGGPATSTKRSRCDSGLSLFRGRRPAAAGGVRGLAAGGSPHPARRARGGVGVVEWAERQLTDEPECVEHGYVACGEAEHALGRGRTDQAEEHAARAVDLGQRFGDPNLVALAVAWQGMCRLARNDVDEGTRLLDEAMTSVVAGELDPHYTGWVHCFAIGMCMGVAGLRRAGMWARAAWDGASSLPEVTPYQGLCRVRQVEVMSLRGELQAAEVEARRACQEMLAFEPAVVRMTRVSTPAVPSRSTTKSSRRNARTMSGECVTTKTCPSSSAIDRTSRASSVCRSGSSASSGSSHPAIIVRSARLARRSPRESPSLRPQARPTEHEPQAVTGGCHQGIIGRPTKHAISAAIAWTQAREGRSLRSCSNLAHEVGKVCGESSGLLPMWTVANAIVDDEIGIRNRADEHVLRLFRRNWNAVLVTPHDECGNSDVTELIRDVERTDAGPGGADYVRRDLQ